MGEGWQIRIFRGGAQRANVEFGDRNFLRRIKIEDAIVHGFRFSFRIALATYPTPPREIAEAALAHVIGEGRTGLSPDADPHKRGK